MSPFSTLPKFTPRRRKPSWPKRVIAVHHVRRGSPVTGCGLVLSQVPSAVWVANKKLTTCSVCLGQLPLPLVVKP